MIRLRARTVFLALLVTLAATVVDPFAPTTAPPEAAPIDDAHAHFRAAEWRNAAAAYQRVVDEDPGNALAWLRLGLSRLELRENESAATALAKANELGIAPPFTRFNLARAFARQDMGSLAIVWLVDAVNAGYQDPERLETDPDLVTIRDHERFPGILDAARMNAQPCAYDERYREFDFWVGRWNVYDPSGQLVGTNEIRKDLRDCVITESWTSASGSAGKSINFFDPAIDRWRQIWTDQAGGNISCQGGLVDGAMHFEGANVARDGSSERFRMTFTPNDDGSVRQFIEQSRDDGATWYVWFDGTYVRMAEPGAAADGDSETGGD